MQVQSLGQEDTLEDEMATHLSILPWENPTGQRSLASNSLQGHKKLDMTEETQHV